MKRNLDPIGSPTLEKPHGGFHPKLLRDVLPASRVPPRSAGNKARYGALSDSTSYSEYAWEFLRRNRYFQQQHDAPMGDSRIILALEKSIADEGAFDSGLFEDVHYQEPYIHKDKKIQIRWALVENVLTHCRDSEYKVQSTIDVPIFYAHAYLRRAFFALDPGFDLPPVDIQIEIVRRFLIEEAQSKKFIMPRERKRKNPSRAKLRNLLRIIDLFSAPNSDLRKVSEAFITHDLQSILFRSPNARSLPTESTGLAGVHQPSRTKAEIAADLREAELKVAEKAISRLATEAFDLVYRGGYSKLIHFDYQT